MLRRCPFGLLVLLLGYGCGSSAPTSFVSEGPAASSTGATEGPDAGSTPVLVSDAGEPGNLGLTEAGGSTSDCAGAASSFIYVISDANDLYTFDPTQFPSPQAFTLVGPVTCNGSGVNSMAVDRSATAWVNFNDGSISKITTTSPVTCTPTAFVTGQAGFTKALGMGFSVDSSGANTETLFVSDNAGPGGDCSKAAPGANCTGKGLGSIDLSTMTLTSLGAYTGLAAGYNAELTGTGDGRLFGFFTTSPAAYGPITKSSGATSTPAPTSIPSVNASTGGYAFSFWGGDFYFYTAPSDKTTVTHLETATGTLTPSPQLTFTIVGAGVSTCAPTLPPK